MSLHSLTPSAAQIFTVGYGNRTPEQLFDLVKSNGCGYLIDVRSSPYSRHHKQYNQQVLEQSSAEYGVKYLYLGEQLGGKPDTGQVDELGRADYGKMAQNPAFKEGLERLLKAAELAIPVALLCAELRPETCHRTGLIGEQLSRRGIQLVHIDEHGKLCVQSAVVQRLKTAQEDLFR